MINKSFDIEGTSNRDDGTVIYVEIEDSDGNQVWNSTVPDPDVNATVDDGTWDMTIPEEVLDEEDTYTIKVYQDPGNDVLEETATVKVEAKKPELTLSAPEEVAMNQKVKVTGDTNLGAGEEVKITITDKSTGNEVYNETVYTSSDGSFEMEWNTRSEGNVNDTTGTFEIKATLVDYDDSLSRGC